MPIFKNKNNLNKNKKETDYTSWEKDFGFLQLILSRKKGITKEFLIGIYANQKVDTKDFLNDEEINPIVENVVTEVIEQIGNDYKSFLINKYFGTEESLIKFLAEDVYVDLISDAIKRNNEKIRALLHKNMIKSLNNLNSGNS